MGRVSGRAWMLAAALALAAVPVAGADVHSGLGSIHHPVVKGDPERAAALRARASELMKDVSRYRKASDLLRQAAALTPVEDANRAHDLHVAANLLFFAGSIAEAQVVMADAADAALARGDVEDAANAFVDAGWLAAKHDQPAEARDLALRAVHLAASPLLSGEQRDRILRRVVAPQVGQLPTGKHVDAVARTGFSVAAQRAAPARRQVGAHGPASRAAPPA